jgi:hypothetical protein
VKRQRPSFSGHHNGRIFGFLGDTSYADASDASFFFLTSWGGQRIAHPINFLFKNKGIRLGLALQTRA